MGTSLGNQARPPFRARTRQCGRRRAARCCREPTSRPAAWPARDLSVSTPSSGRWPVTARAAVAFARRGGARARADAGGRGLHGLRVVAGTRLRGSTEDAVAAADASLGADEELRRSDPMDALDSEDIVAIEQPALVSFVNEHIGRTLEKHAGLDRRRPRGGRVSRHPGRDPGAFARRVAPPGFPMASPSRWRDDRGVLAAGASVAAWRCNAMGIDALRDRVAALLLDVRHGTALARITFASLALAMGVEVPRESFEEDDYARFAEKLKLNCGRSSCCRSARGLARAQRRSARSSSSTWWAPTAAPALINREVLERVDDERLTLEVNRFNLEINARPSPLEGRPFSAMHAELGPCAARGAPRRARAWAPGSGHWHPAHAGAAPPRRSGAERRQALPRSRRRADAHSRRGVRHPHRG